MKPPLYLFRAERFQITVRHIYLGPTLTYLISGTGVRNLKKVIAFKFSRPYSVKIAIK